MASKLHAEASLASEGDCEQRWIEWESLVEKHQQQQEQRRGDLYEETARSDDADDDILSNLFSDPDPHDLFCLEFTTKQCPGETDNNHTSRTGARICIELEGYKAELGQTLHSTGLTLWRASHRLCDFLLLDDYAREYIHEKRVLELGAGLGLCGILAHLLQPRPLSSSSLILTDGDTNTLEYTRKNIQRNCAKHCGDATSTTSSKIACHQLIWGPSFAETFRSEHGTFDTIMGSDIIYVEQLLEPLWATVATLLSKPNGRFLLAFAQRNVKMDLVLEHAEKVSLQISSKPPPPSDGEGVFVFEWSTNVVC